MPINYVQKIVPVFVDLSVSVGDYLPKRGWIIKKKMGGAKYTADVGTPLYIAGPI